MTSIHVALIDGLARITHHEGHWHIHEQDFDGHPLCLALDPWQPGRLYCGTLEHGLQVSDNDGETWKPLTTEHDVQKMVTAVAVSRHKPQEQYGTVWIGTGPGAIWHSEDGGQHWLASGSLQEFQPDPTTTTTAPGYPDHIRWIEPDPHDERTLFVALDQGQLLRSRTGGEKWEAFPSIGQGKGHTLRTHIQAPGRLYEAAGGEKAAFRPRLHLAIPPFEPRIVVKQGGYAESHDHGDRWQLLDQGLEQNHYLWSLAIDPGDPETILASAAIGPLQAHELYICRTAILRRSRGQSWQPITTGLPKPSGMLISVLSTNEAEPGTFYAANNYGIFRSTDTGLTWQELPIAWPASYRQQHIQSLIVCPSLPDG